MQHKQQTLRYTERSSDIRTVGSAIDLLSHGQTAEALEVLMAYRNYLQDMQTPQVIDYDPRQAQMEAVR